MSDDTMPNLEAYIEEVASEVAAQDADNEESPPETETTEEIEEESAPEEVFEPEEPEAPPPPPEELFDLPPKPKGKKKKQLSEKQLANLAKAREKAAIKRKAIAAAKKKDRELELAEKKAHIKKRKARQLQQQAEIEAYSEEIVMKREQSMWDENKLVGLMNRTMDTYFEKRKAEKEKRAAFPVDPSVYAQYQPGMPPQRAIPRQPQAPPKPRTNRNQYSAMFGLTPEDEDLYGL